MVEVPEKKRVSPYRLNLVPGKEYRRPEWNLILVTNVPVTVDFFHTDMLERVISIQGVPVEEVKEAIKEE